MSKYPEELKKQVVKDYIRGDRQTAEILAMYDIPKSNLFRWLKKYGPPKEVDPPDEFTPRNFYLRGLRIERLETIVSILKHVRCTVDAPLPDRLMELERLHGEYPSILSAMRSRCPVALFTTTSNGTSGRTAYMYGGVKHSGSRYSRSMKKQVISSALQRSLPS